MRVAQFAFSPAIWPGRSPDVQPMATASRRREPSGNNRRGMPMMTADLLSQLSDAIADRTSAAAPLVVAIGASGAGALSGILWRADVVVTSEQALGEYDGYSVTLSDGTEAAARLAGRDAGTNVAALKLANPVASPTL